MRKVCEFLQRIIVETFFPNDGNRSAVDSFEVTRKHARALQREKTTLTRPYPLIMANDLAHMPIT